MAAEPRLDRLELSMTDTCNLACDYCDVAHNLVESVKRAITPELVERVVGFTASRAGQAGVDVLLTGGEPLSYWPALVSTVDAFRSGLGARLRRLRIATNAILLRPDRADWLAECQVGLVIGLDGVESAHDAHRRNSAGIGSWRRTVQGARNAVAAGIRPDLSMVVTADTIALAGAGIDWLCEAFAPGELTVAVAEPARLGTSAWRPDALAWADLIETARDRWSGRGIKIVAPVPRSGDTICIDVRGRVASGLAELAAGVGCVPLERFEGLRPAGRER